MTILTQIGFDQQQRHELIYNWTTGRTKSTKDLKPKELNDLYWKLVSDHKFTSKVEADNKELMKKKRSIVLSIATKVGIHDTNNWEIFNQFMLNSSVFKKPLKYYKIDELDALIRQFRSIKANYNQSAKKIGTKAFHHKYNIPVINPN